MKKYTICTHTRLLNAYHSTTFFPLSEIVVAEHDGELTCLSRNAIDSSVKINKCNKTGNVSVYIVDENAVVEEMNKGKPCSSHDFIQKVPFSLPKRLPLSLART